MLSALSDWDPQPLERFLRSIIDESGFGATGGDRCS
jgi:hypothetical protein